MRGVIYLIVNLTSRNFYVGCTVNPDTRWIKNHLPQLRAGKHENPHLQHSFNKYGECQFAYLPFYECPASVLHRVEWYFIQQLRPQYNMVRHMRGLSSMTEERKQRIRLATSMSCKKMWEERTDQERKAIRDNQSVAHKKRWANMDPEKKAAIAKKNSENMKAIWTERKRLKSSGLS